MSCYTTFLLEKPMEHETEENTLKALKNVVPHDILRCYTTFPVELDAEEGSSEQTRVTRHSFRKNSLLHDIHHHRLTNSINKRSICEER